MSMLFLEINKKKYIFMPGWNIDLKTKIFNTENYHFKFVWQ